MENQVFLEIESGLSPQQAMAEANRCLKCHNPPCNAGCPAGVDVARFIRQIASNNLSGAIKAIREDNIFPGACARICPQTVLCEGKCSGTELAQPIRIGKLQRFAADTERQKGAKLLRKLAPTGHKAAVVGSGPAGLSAAAALVRLGYEVDVFEKRSLPGGLLAHVIPAYRLPYAVLKDEIDYIKALGVDIHCDTPVEDIPGLLAKYAAVFAAIGAGRPRQLGVEGEGLAGVVQGLDFLEKIRQAEIKGLKPEDLSGKRVEVIGGGNTAMDAAVSARKLGAGSVTVRYRRSEKEMPAWERERKLAAAEGVQFRFLCSPKRFLGEAGSLRRVEYVGMELTAPDASGRPRPLPISGSMFSVDCDLAIIAAGQHISETLLADRAEFPGGASLLKAKEDTGETSVEGVFAGGDLVNGGATAVLAIGDGKKAALAMDQFIKTRGK
jgi:glutamate synthase (NADPH/NADH) small chain